MIVIGIMACPYKKSEDDLEMQFQTNHLGHFLFTILLLPLVRKGAPSRIVNLSSIAHLSNIKHVLVFSKNYLNFFV